jgi:hypothetical protein
LDLLLLRLLWALAVLAVERGVEEQKGWTLFLEMSPPRAVVRVRFSTAKLVVTGVPAVALVLVPQGVMVLPDKVLTVGTTRALVVVLGVPVETILLGTAD